MRVEVYSLKRRVRKLPNGFSLAPHGRLAWLHRLLWRALEKMGTLKQEFEDREKVIRLPLDTDQILDRILAQYEGLFDVDRPPSEILIGRNDFAKLVGCPALQRHDNPFSFEVEAELREGRPTGRTIRKIFNLPIRVVPQMDGVLVLDR